MERMDGPDLFDSLYTEDVEGQKLNTMPSVDELIAEYGKKFTGTIIQVTDTISGRRYCCWQVIGYISATTYNKLHHTPSFISHP